VLTQQVLLHATAPCPPPAQLGEGGYAYVFLVREVPTPEQPLVEDALYALKRVRRGPARQQPAAGLAADSSTPAGLGASPRTAPPLPPLPTVGREGNPQGPAAPGARRGPLAARAGAAGQQQQHRPAAPCSRGR
jgi:hypothetical protein